jgi:uncharacterized DUF497 family protein
MGAEFEWDADKAAANAQKHDVTFEEAVTVFADPLARVFDDPDHSETEARELLIGWSNRNRVLIVSFTEREATIRIISARPATKRERHDYEENTKETEE